MDMELTAGNGLFYIAAVFKVITPSDVIPVGRSVVWH